MSSLVTSKKDEDTISVSVLHPPATSRIASPSDHCDQIPVPTLITSPAKPSLQLSSSSSVTSSAQKVLLSLSLSFALYA